MTRTSRKLSDIILEMGKSVLRDPQAPASSEATHAALLLAHVAWNRSLGQLLPESQYRPMLEELERSNRGLWSELTGDDTEEMIGTLVDFKRARHPADDRVIHVCGMRDGNVHVEWYEGEDVRDAERIADERLGRALTLIMNGEEEEAVQHLRRSTGLAEPDIRRTIKELRQAMESRPDA